MADVENVSAVNAGATTSSQAVTGADIPTAQDTFVKLGEGGGPVNEVIIESNQTSNDLGTSPTQEKSSNSHPHDSEYDTASDLEGNEEYDDDDMDDSLTEDDEDDSEDETETDDDEEDDDEGVDVDLQGQEKIDAEAQKKVDEDRSNPQYIPKRGTFYEHDDRTAEVEGNGEGGDGQEAGESPVVITGGSSSVAGSKTATTPTISSASKTMKKWQPASAVDRWSHDRFDPSEQAPKSRAELVNAYGYDIRTEDAPPKARRRRRYGRGPSKYNRNWEDESAYLKTSNKERKPPKPSDFPALNENSSKPRRPRRTREEKENRMDRKKREGKTSEGRTERTDKMGPSSRNNNHNDEHDHRVEQRNDRSDRHNDGGYKQQNRQKSFNHRGQGQNQASVGRQAAMEFKQKNRQNYQNSSNAQANTNTSTLSSRLESQRQQPQQNQQQQPQQQNMSRKSVNNVGNSKDHNQPMGNQNQQQQNQQYDGFNNNKKKHLEQGYQPMQAVQQHSTLTQQQHQQQAQSSPLINHSVNRQNTQIQNKTQQQPTSNLSQRLQQVQNRNDPSHVGSVQMHALATQNQQQQLLQQQQAANVMMTGPPQAQIQQSQNQNINQQPMEQRGPPKRYSSLRRSQHDGQHLADHQQQQQLQQQIHMQQQQQQQNQAPPAMIMSTDQAMIQANLMQMYHQEKLQAQMQALQVSQQPTVAKTPNYAGQGPQGPPQQPYPGTTPTPAAYFVASPDAYTAAATAAATAQATQAAASYAAQQANPNYLAQQQTAAAAAAAAASLVYNNPNNAPQQSVAAATAYGPAAQVGVVTQPQTGSTTTSGYQNYNTVGGTTYFVPPPTQTSTRPVSLPQRRPTNAIPILPPSEKQKQKSQDSKVDNDTKVSTNQSSSNQAPVGSAENIDHIIDNMFVQRPAFQPPPATTTTAGAVANATSKSNDIAAAAADNLNNTSSPSQDSNALITENVTIKSPNDTTAVITTASSATTTATTTASTESSNNNQISAQE